MDENTAWEQFSHTGKVDDYLAYRNCCNQRKGAEDDGQNQGNRIAPHLSVRRGQDAYTAVSGPRADRSQGQGR